MLFELTITAKGFNSSDPNFDYMDLNKKKFLYDVISVGYFEGNVEKKHEDRAENRTMPRMVFEIFEKEIDQLSTEERHNFPTKRLSDSNSERGIYLPNERGKPKRGTMKYKDKYEISCGGIFSTVQIGRASCRERV